MSRGRSRTAGREFAAPSADVVFTRHGTLEAGRAFCADVKGRLAAYGRAPDDLRIMPGVTFVLGDTAEQLEECVGTDAADGFILVPHLTPGGLDEFVERVVPLLQERGVYRTEYRGATLRSHLGLPEPAWKG
ncbi:LLM class flavin-dependent oxidoreductase [Streptomyces flavofungini]|uniref:LLM class flavin-dependent oxidoreductase n=1 Tax=Streptomyces flavofungini TaxID=68200 RepID=UPI00339D3E5D